MDFKKTVKVSRFLDPFDGFAPTERLSEVRSDPLTGHTCRILDFPVKELVRSNLEELVEKSRSGCPFCPDMIEIITPKFHPDLLRKERYQRGEALCFPNVFPYDENGAVTVMCREHYVALGDFSAEMLKNAIGCCIEYLGDLFCAQPDTVYQSVNWNYMPLAGGSIVHPHLQVTASSSATNYYCDTLRSLKFYAEHTGSDFWRDLVDAERLEGERFVAAGRHIEWLVAFAPMGVFDALGVLPGIRDPEDLKNELMDELVNGVLNIIRYVDALNMYSFNMSLYFMRGEDCFVPHVRICPRVSIPPLGASQVNYMRMLHNESMTTISPEEVCRGLKLGWK